MIVNFFFIKFIQLPKNDHIEPIIRLKEEQISDNENSSREGMLSIAEESNEPIDPSSTDDNHQVPKEMQFYSHQNREVNPEMAADFRNR